MDIKRESRRIAAVWLALLVLLALTAASAYLKLGAANSVINMAIALVKAALVAVFFMHLRGSHALVRVIAATALFTLALLFAVSSTDYATRMVFRAPLQAPVTGGR
ncbi:cytochrome c oxidase subunit 4 [Paucimonas lemoignei]|uniref:Cytochrome c oxidase subunit 4 n=1 Tax=Paucimonas lemoignei TaxID=29443 RepID=A0A4R3I1G4_PAULE|nr:cytochrome C oxidase subunit IV family protein [Paucimonas lemoignei]TCS39372.1 cytochrome c oxidase subunit 4 [Paucimonas lemoignei]